MSAVSARFAYWPVALIRAIPAVVVGLVITFSADHTALFGLVAFGAFSVVSGAILAWGAFRIEDRVLRGLALAQGAVAVVAGAIALVFCTTGSGTLFLIVVSFAALTGFLELYLGLRSRRRHPSSRDWTAAGVMTALLALAVLLVPADYALPWHAEDKGVGVSGVLTSEIIVVGILGAYAILLGVYLAIGGLSARWAAQEKATPENATGDKSAPTASATGGA